MSSQLLENFRKQTIEKSLQLASQRISTHRKLLITENNNNNNVDAAASTSTPSSLLHHHKLLLTQDHLRSIATDELQNFGTIATVSSPFQGIRVNCSATTTSTKNNQDPVLLQGYTDGSIGLWSVPDGRWLAHGQSGESDDFKFSGYAAKGVALTTITSNNNDNEGKRFLMASTHRNGVLVLWKCEIDKQHSTTSHQQLAPFAVVEKAHHHQENISSTLRQCEFSPVDSSILATSGDDGTVKIWSIQDAHRSITPLLSLENGPSQQKFATTTNANNSALFSSSSSSSSSLSQPTPGTRCLAFHPDGALLAVGDSSGSVSLWDLRDASRLYNSSSLKPLHSGRINDIQMNSNGYNFCTGGDDGLLYSFDLRKLSSSSSSTVSAASSTPYVWRQAAHGDAVTTLAYGKSHSLMLQNSSSSLSIKDSSVIFSGGLDGIVVAWDSWTGEQLWRSENTEVKNYVTWPKIVKGEPRKPAIRSLSYVSSSTNETNEISNFLVVMKREAQWNIYSAESGSYAGNRNVSVVGDAYQQLLMSSNSQGTDDESNNKNHGQTSMALQSQKDTTGDESDDSDDDDILGALMKKK